MNYYYNPSEIQSNEEIRQIQINLKKLELFPYDITGNYDLNTSKTVMSFQTKYSLSPTGTMDDNTYNKLVEVSTNTGTLDTIVYYENQNVQANPGATASTEYNHYFDKNNSKLLRKNDIEMVIEYGAQKQLTKRIVAIKLRSVGQDIDPSGNAICDVYEFLGKDLYESDN